jgi:4-hydroxy-3-methylbut-2-enyl diphosphate reductase
VDDTAAIVAVLQRRFPLMVAPHKEDICYATTNRQEAVKALAAGTDLVLVIGAPNSSNSVRLVEVAERAGAKSARLIASAQDIDWAWLSDARRVGVTAGASAPEDLVQGVVDALRARFAVTLEEVRVTDEDVVFKLPRVLAETTSGA